MKLATLQRRFHAAITAPTAAADFAWDAEARPGIRVYRNAYRARLVACLRDTYAKTLAWIGDDAFDAAACHHAILHPPRSWTLDDAGHGFADTLAGLFPDDPEVAELAWLEWTMQEVFTGRDCASLDPAGFAAATAGWDEAAWSLLTFAFVPTLTSAPVLTDCAGLWNAIEANLVPSAVLVLAQPAVVAVWREGFRPRFRSLTEIEAAGLELARGGATFGALCDAMTERLGEQAGIAEAGRMLGWWVGEGLLDAAAGLLPCPGARNPPI